MSTKAKIGIVGTNGEAREIEIFGVQILFFYAEAVAFEVLRTKDRARTAQKFSPTTARHINAFFGASACAVLPPQEFAARLASVLAEECAAAAGVLATEGGK